MLQWPEIARKVTEEDGFWYRQDQNFLWYTGGIVPSSKYTNFLIDHDLVRAFAESKMTSPKNFVRERYMDKFTAYQVIKRMEG